MIKTTRSVQASNFGKFILALLLVVSWSSVVNSQSVRCDLDSTSVSLEGARKSLEKNRFSCAVQECQIILSQTEITPEVRAQALILVGLARYYEGQASLKDEVVSTFLDARRAYSTVYSTLPKLRIELDTLQGELASYWQESGRLLMVELGAEAFRQRELCQRQWDQYRKSRATHRLLAYSTLGLAAASGVGAYLAHSKANDYYDQYEISVDPMSIESNWESYDTKRKLGNALIAATAGIVAGEVLLMILRPHKPDCEEPSRQETGDKAALLLTSEGDGLRLSVRLSLF